MKRYAKRQFVYYLLLRLSICNKSMCLLFSFCENNNIFCYNYFLGIVANIQGSVTKTIEHKPIKHKGNIDHSVRNKAF